MDASALRTELRTFIAGNFLYSDDPVADDASLLESGLIDSTGAMELISHVEALLGVTFDDDQLVAANFDSVDRIVAFASRVTG